MSVQSEITRLEAAKAAIGEAIAAKGVDVPTGTMLDDMGGLIVSIETGVDTSDATATAGDIAEGTTAYVNGEKVSGTVKKAISGNSVGWPDLDATALSVSAANGNIGLKTTVKQSEHSGLMYQNGASVFMRTPAENFGDATADDVAAGKTFTSAAGLKVTGTASLGNSLPDGAIAVQMVTGEQASVQIGSGYSLSITYGDALEIDDRITLAFVGTTRTLSNISNSTDFSVLTGKYVSTGSTMGSSTSKYYYIPSGATFTVGGSTYSKTLTCDKAQAVSLQKVSL